MKFPSAALFLVLVVFSCKNPTNGKEGKKRRRAGWRHTSAKHAADNAGHMNKIHKAESTRNTEESLTQSLGGKNHGTYGKMEKIDEILAISDNNEFTKRVFQMMKEDDSDVLKEIDEDEEPLLFAPVKSFKLGKEIKSKSGRVSKFNQRKMSQSNTDVEKRQMIHPAYNMTMTNMATTYQTNDMSPMVVQPQTPVSLSSSSSSSSSLTSSPSSSLPSSSSSSSSSLLSSTTSGSSNLFSQGSAEKETSFAGQRTMKSSRVCKPGPPLASNKRLPNCLLIGDSITLGSSYAVVAALQGRCVVQVSPFSRGGGALDSNYGLECIQLILSTTNLTPTRYDAIIFNFGMHDIDFSGMLPEEFNDEAEYARNVGRIKSILQKSGAGVAFSLTTPVPYDKKKNDLVIRYNKIAEKVMSKAPSIDTIDLYDFVTEKCGKIPFKNCFMMKRPNDVHYGLAGSILLGKQIAAKMAEILKSRNLWVKRGYSLPENANLTEPLFSGLKEDSVKCSTNDTVPTRCPSESTCVPNKYSRSNFACCMLENGVDCKDNSHCCPEDSICHPKCSVKWCECISK